LSDKYFRERAIHALEENVDKKLRLREWPVYENYEITFDEAGKRYVRAPEDNRVKKQLQPLSRVSADLFLRFAGWVEEFSMDSELDTKDNAKAAKLWAETFGVLGMNSADATILDMLNSHRVTADYLGMPWRGDVGRGRRSSAQGGQPDESVENFAFEAWEAHIVWQLYKSVRSQAESASTTARKFMSTFDHGERMPISDPHGELTIQRLPWVERTIYSEDADLTRRWTLTVVEDAVNRKIENHCFPIVQGAPGSYEPGWGIRSLLGAMWLQMMFLMRADRRCDWCKSPLDPGRRSHARFCDNDGQCRWDWNYHKGSGKSSKHARREARYIR
jgi:hypothetical protein